MVGSKAPWIRSKDFKRDANFEMHMQAHGDEMKQALSDSPLAPQWYRFEDAQGRVKLNGDIMLSVWLGTQADEAFQEARVGYFVPRYTFLPSSGIRGSMPSKLRRLGFQKRDLP